MTNISIIGGGVMGQTIALALLKKKIINSSQLIVSDPSGDVSGAFKKMRVAVVRNNQIAIAKAKIIILAVKPQQSKEVFLELKGKVNKSTLVISIMAGVKREKIVKGLGITKVIRAMPNMVVKVGLGMTVWCSTSACNNLDLEVVKEILASFGKQILVKSDDMVDRATVVSGSGPAYVFYLAELLEREAKKLGFSGEDARLLSLQTIIGASKLLQVNLSDPAALRKAVTSKGGVTEAAFTKLHPQLEVMFSSAIKAGLRRAQKLGK